MCDSKRDCPGGDDEENCSNETGIGSLSEDCEFVLCLQPDNL